MSDSPPTHNLFANLPVMPTGPIQDTRTFFDDNWNFTIHYPSDWNIIYENEPVGAWTIPIAIAGPGVEGERPVFMVSARCGTIQQGADELPRAIQDYIAASEAELGRSLAGYQLISTTIIHLAQRPTAWLVYSYNGKQGRIYEESFTMFDARTTFWFVCRASLACYAQMRPCFQSILASFRIGREMAERADEPIRAENASEQDVEHVE